MSTEDPQPEVDAHDRAPSPDIPEPSDPPIPEPTSPSNPRKRPRIDLDNVTGGRERKKGKSMFGILLGTLNKARSEDKERSASEAAKKRQLLEQRLANKLKSESDSVRKAESSKKQKSQATRTEEDLCVKDSIYKLRYKRMPLLAGFLCTSDQIPEDGDVEEEDAEMDLEKVLVNPPRSHPPPLYYLPAKLLPRQEKWLKKRQENVRTATEKERELFLSERSKGIEEIQKLRKEAEAEAAAAASRRSPSVSRGETEKMDTDDKDKEKGRDDDVDMDASKEKGDQDDAVEY